MFFILERFSRQHQDIVFTKDKISFRYERVVIAQYDSDDDTLGQMELGNTFLHPGIAGCQMDLDKVYVSFLPVFAHPFDAGILVYETGGYDTGGDRDHTYAQECDEDTEQFPKRSDGTTVSSVDAAHQIPENALVNTSG